jgi:DNA-directed RNA polymerase subunit N (RpoN/RPB10)
MIPLVRCTGCGRLFPQDLYERFDAIKMERDPVNEMTKKNGVITYTDGISYSDFFDKEGIKRLCCRANLTTTMRIDDKIS